MVLTVILYFFRAIIFISYVLSKLEVGDSQRLIGHGILGKVPIFFNQLEARKHFTQF